jgi:hypothetical protein
MRVVRLLLYLGYPVLNFRLTSWTLFGRGYIRDEDNTRLTNVKSQVTPLAAKN